VLPVLTPSESAELDRRSAERGISVEALMERAGRAVATQAAALAGGRYGRRAVVVCGKGNNGGDGLVAARYLARWGLGVSVVLIDAAEAFRDPSASNLDRLSAEAPGVRVIGASGANLARELRRADVAVDAMVGTGFRGRAEGTLAAAIEALNGAVVPVVAVDVPSGVNGETGAVDGPAVRARATVTLGVWKPGLLLHPGAGLAGRVTVADIGFAADLVRGELSLVEPADVVALLPARPPDTHKRASGVVMVLGGSVGMTGAPLLTAAAASRAGAGLVTVATVASRLPVVQAGLVEAVFLPLPETGAGTVSGLATERLLEGLDRHDALALGPGLTTEAETAGVVRDLVRSSPAPMVLDADGLNAFAGRAGDLTERRSELVLTPHAGELARLVGVSPGEAARDRIGLSRKLAAETGAVVVFKGDPTGAASPSGEARINPTGGPALATAGTGDVLTGTIAALLARGLRPLDAAMAGVFVHGRAGDLAADELGEGLVAGDVLDRLPAAARELRR
jgi:NAD(P)H-hydrate epimerase